MTCKDLGTTCNMIEVLKEELIPIYFHKEVDKDSCPCGLEDTTPIRYEKRFTAYYECEKCKRRIFLAVKQTDAYTTQTFDDLVKDVSLENKPYQKKLS